MKITTELPLKDIKNLGDLQQAITHLYDAHAPATASIDIKFETRWEGYGPGETKHEVATAIVVSWGT